MDVAADLLLRLGYSRISIDDISRQAGIGKGTIYLHWATREELFYAVIMREQLAAVEEQLVALRRDVTEVQAHRLVRWKYVTAMSRPILRAIMRSDPEIMGRLVQLVSNSSQLVKLMTTISTDYFQALIEHRLLRDDLPCPTSVRDGRHDDGVLHSQAYLLAFGCRTPTSSARRTCWRTPFARSFSLPPYGRGAARRGAAW